ncbi:MAG TPA: Na+/H+ antiporter subunit E [Atribacteraceae bacterium]|nr:Na+/H+ antiporter subunit E [Atribacteraceae bacterium]
MSIPWKSRIIVFILSLVGWCLIAPPTRWPDFLVGVGVALLVSGLTGGILLKSGRSFHINRLYHVVVYLGILLWEMARANLDVALLVLKPRLVIKPGFVRIKTTLQEDSSIALLANSITLTPGTLTVDVDQSRKLIYIHCIVVQPADLDESTSAIGKSFNTILQKFMR